jgi:hypothetical protein
MKELKILNKKVKAESLKEFAENWYLDFLKGCVDLENNKVAIGGDYHMETCELLTNSGGKHVNIWGFNIRFFDNGKHKVEFDSLVNIKPKINNGRTVESQEIRERIEELVRNFILLND